MGQPESTGVEAEHRDVVERRDARMVAPMLHGLDRTFGLSASWPTCSEVSRAGRQDTRNLYQEGIAGATIGTGLP
jgi:hypothetical protein